MSSTVFGLPLTLLLAACTPSGMDMTTDTAPAAATGGKASFRHNPASRQALRITMTIKDAPGPFRWMRPIAHYDVVNRECLSPPKDNPGGRSAPTPTAPTDFVLKPAADGVYTGVVYADLMEDEDYVGNGVCRWALTSIVVQMKATGADGETLFTPNIPQSKLAPGNTETVYFNKAAYSRKDGSGFANAGLSDRSRFGPSIHDADLFTVTFAIAKEGAP
ncbi:MAG: hypothetical protein IAE66_07450 [Xanthomonadaceae bacterium]|nr:hypothetical protein [Xanthomonadaceae bacterium]